MSAGADLVWKALADATRKPEDPELTTAGADSFTVPQGVKRIMVEVRGGRGSGNAFFGQDGNPGNVIVFW